MAKDDNPFTGGGGTSGGTSSGSSSSSGGSSTPRPSPVEPYLALLQSLFIPLTPEARAWAQQAARNRWGQAEALYHLRQTRFYREAFPGIFNPDGTLRMTEAQYIATRNAYEDIAASVGIRLNDAQIAHLFRNDVSVSAFRTRAQAVATMRDNRVAFQQFKQTLEAMGIKRDVRQKDLLDFVAGRADPEWYRIWREAQARTAATMAGLNVRDKGEAAGQTSIGRGLVKRVAAAGLSDADLQKSFEQLADLFLSVLPESQIRGIGLNKRQLVTAVVGGKNAARAREVLGQLMRNIQAFEQTDRASQQLVPTATGALLVGGKAPTQRSE
jgi:hypothetical protein